MIGKSIAECVMRNADLESPESVFFKPQAVSRKPQAKGFTLLELMIVISIIVILAVVIMPQYQKVITHTKETVLRDDLFQLRKVIDQYVADKGKPAQSPDDLVSAGYMREIPVDPITGEKDWQWVVGEDAASAEGEQGITDVHSASSDQSSEGTEYNTW